MFLNVLILQQPEAYIGKVSVLLNDKGELADESTRSFLKDYMAAFAKWVGTVSSH